MPVKKRDHSKDTKIDIDNLQIEWVNQADNYDYWSDIQASAQEERDYAKNREALVFAQISNKIRLNWKKYFSSKPTEPAIKAKALENKKYKKAQIDVIKANKRLTLANNKLRALEHKKRALENLSSFFIGNFFSEPSMKRVKKKVNMGSNRNKKNK